MYLHGHINGWNASDDLGWVKTSCVYRDLCREVILSLLASVILVCCTPNTHALRSAIFLFDISPHRVECGSGDFLLGANYNYLLSCLSLAAYWCIGSHLAFVTEPWIILFVSLHGLDPTHFMSLSARTQPTEEALMNNMMWQGTC